MATVVYSMRERGGVVERENLLVVLVVISPQGSVKEARDWCRGAGGEKSPTASWETQA